MGGPLLLNRGGGFSIFMTANDWARQHEEDLNTISELKDKLAAKTPNIVSVHVNDGAALYINGKLVSNWFTCGQSNILNALGFKKWEEKRGDEKHYKTNDFPPLLKDCILAA